MGEPKCEGKGGILKRGLDVEMWLVGVLVLWCLEEKDYDSILNSNLLLRNKGNSYSIE